MHKDVPEEFKPIILQNGLRVEFPPPTQKLRKPRVKHGSSADVKTDSSKAACVSETVDSATRNP